MTTLPPLDTSRAPGESVHAPKPRVDKGFETHLHLDKSQLDLSKSDQDSGHVPLMKPAVTDAAVVRPAIGQAVGGVLPHDVLAPIDARLTTAGAIGRVYLQSLHVVGYLSMLTQGGQSVETPSSLTCLAADVMNHVVQATEGMQVAAQREAFEGSGSVVTAKAAEVPLSTEWNEDEAPTVSGSSPTAARDVSATWAKQFVHLTGAEQVATLWIRDYRLDAAQRRAIADHLRALARVAGEPVARVVVNGEEIWRDGAVAVTDYRGNQHGR